MSTQLRTPRGNEMTLATREGTNDGAIAHGIIGGDDYRLRRPVRLSGWAIDVGSHIGTVAVALALDHPDLRVVAVEALPENAEMVRRNAEDNGVSDRVFTVQAAAEAPGRKTATVRYDYDEAPDLVDTGYLHESRYIGNMLASHPGTKIRVAAISLDAILDRFGIDRVALLKIDCEGCEYRFLRSPAVARVDRIVGEYHDGDTPATIRQLLEETHALTFRNNDPIGLFEGVRR